jgi:hypothetical protein
MMNDNSLDTDEAQLFAAVHGVTPSGAPPDDLGAYLHSMRSELCQPADAQARWNHLAAMRRAFPKPQTRRKFRGVIAIVAATAGLVTVTTGLAAADRLPQAAQDQVAKLAEVVGVDLPGNDHTPAATSPKPTAGLDGATQGTAPASGGERPDSVVTTAKPGAIETPSGRGSGSASDGTPAATAPGQTGHTPSGTGTTPGGATIPPGQGSSDPGQSGNAPGQGGSGPGNSENAPGHVGDSPGKSGMAPGQTGSAGESASAGPPASAGTNSAAAAHANPHADSAPVSKLVARAIASVTIVPSTDVNTP